MKILFLTTSFRLKETNEAIGGGEISNRLLMQLLSEENEVRVVSIHGSNIWDENYGNITVYDVSTRVSESIFKKVRSIILYKKIAKKICNEFNPEIILCATSIAGIAINLGKYFDIPTGLIVRAYENFSHGDDSKLGKSSCRRRILDSMKSIIYGKYQGKILRKLNFFIANSKYIQQKFYKYTSVKKSIVIQPTISLNQRKFDYKLINKIVMVGTSEKKGCSIFKKLAAEYSNYNFHIIGDKDIQPGKFRTYSKNLKIHGWIRKPANFIEESDLVLVPSMWNEPYGRIAIEAIKLGKIVLVANVGGLPEAVCLNENLIVKNNSITEWISKLEEVIKYPDMYSYESEKVAAFLNIDSVDEDKERLNNFLKSLINR